jgi:hypothetical protein
MNPAPEAEVEACSDEPKLTDEEWAFVLKAAAEDGDA